MGLFGKKDPAEQPPQEPLKQDRAQQDQFQQVFFMHLLFREKPELPSEAALLDALRKRFGEVDLVVPFKDEKGGDNRLVSFGVKKYTCEFQDGSMPAQIMMYGFDAHKENDALTPLQRSQFWDVPDGGAVYDSCPYAIWLSDFMAATLPAEDRCNLLMDWLEVALELLPQCTAVYTPSSGKLILADALRQSKFTGMDRYIANCVNVRFFNIDGTEDDHIVDTTGLYSIHLPDIQYHFHGLNPDSVVNHAYNFASYILANPGAIKDGDTVDGIDPATGQMSQDAQWVCGYEEALIQPVRPVLDVHTGPNAAGQR